MDKKELWLNIANYHFENLVPTALWDHIAAQFGGQNAFTKAFADKLSRKFHWERSFALRAIWEYKKFVYLGVISDHSVTPSRVIDQVWHEHLLFSAGYRKFCRDIIRYEFDHHPELVAIDSQTAAFQSQFHHTLELYKKEFGIEPPSEIWGAAKFKVETVPMEAPSKRQENTAHAGDYAGTEPLISMFPTALSSDVEFGGGEFGGGGGSGSWGDGGSDAGGVDAGGSSDGGSSCSSSCGGGCGGD